MQNPHECLLKTCQQLNNLGLNKGTSGNASVRFENGFLITPSGIPINEMTADHMVKMQFDGSFEAHKELKSLKPSSEWRFHRDILALDVAKPDIANLCSDINAVIHTHSMFATTLACMHKDIPAFHYMIAVAGGDSIRYAPYALFGSQALSDNALTALQDRKACLLANHGMICLGRDLEDALAVAVEVENLCEQYWRILQVNSNPPLLSVAEMREVFHQFRGYGKWAK